jgi:hypothetical protein
MLPTWKRTRIIWGDSYLHLQKKPVFNLISDRTLSDLFAEYQITKGGPIILVQVRYRLETLWSSKARLICDFRLRTNTLVSGHPTRKISHTKKISSTST